MAKAQVNTIDLSIRVIFESTMTEVQAKQFVEDLLKDHQGTEHKTIFCHAWPNKPKEE